MHSLRQFALLATTFVTAVLANPMNNVHTRRDSASNATDLANAITSAGSSVQLVSRDLQNISSTASESGKQTFLSDFSTAGHDVETLRFFLTSVEPFGEDDSRKLVNDTLLSFFLTLNDTTNAINPDFTDELNTLEFSSFVASFTDMITGADALQAAMTNLLTPNATEQLNPVSSSVNDNLETTLLSLEVSFERANERATP